MAVAAFRQRPGTIGRASASQISARCVIRCQSIFSSRRRSKGSKAVLVRLLGGLDYWRYGGEQLSRHCRELGIALAIVPGDGRPDMRLAALSTVSGDDLARLEALLDAGGVENTRAGPRRAVGTGSGQATSRYPTRGPFRVSAFIVKARNSRAARIGGARILSPASAGG